MGQSSNQAAPKNPVPFHIILKYASVTFKTLHQGLIYFTLGLVDMVGVSFLKHTDVFHVNWSV